MSLLADAYSSEKYSAFAKEALTVLLHDYQKQLTGNSKVSNTVPANELLAQWQNKTWTFSDLLQQVSHLSMHIHNPRYMGHQVSAPLPIAIIMDWVAAHYNNGMAVYEMGQASSVADDVVIKKLATWLHLPNTTNGILTSGGTIGNLTALLAARKNAAPHTNLAVLVSAEAHYSLVRSAYIMGIPKENIYYLPTNEQLQVDVQQLPNIYNKALADGKHVFALCANACSTSTGAYDPIDAMADFAELHNIWFHIDGAHGGAVGLSTKYKHLTEGIEKADSIVIDFHKMLLCPALITAVLYKNANASFLPFEQKAAYLLSDEPEWENMAMRTAECTKYMMSLKALAVMDVYGKNIFEEFITRQHDLTITCAAIISNASNFELALAPQSNILCFRYSAENSNVVNLAIRQAILEDGTFYIVKTEINGEVFLRCTFMNPFTTAAHFEELLACIRKIVKREALIN
jgi:L-2,4-diaminobutyrate decarboxylase